MKQPYDAWPLPRSGKFTLPDCAKWANRLWSRCSIRRCGHCSWRISSCWSSFAASCTFWNLTMVAEAKGIGFLCKKTKTEVKPATRARGHGARGGGSNIFFSVRCCSQPGFRAVRRVSLEPRQFLPRPLPHSFPFFLVCINASLPFSIPRWQQPARQRRRTRRPIWMLP